MGQEIPVDKAARSFASVDNENFPQSTRSGCESPVVYVGMTATVSGEREHHHMENASAEHGKHFRARKGFAQIRGQTNRNPAYFVSDPEDWELIKELDRGQLVCHQPNCSVAFQKPRVSSRGLRYLSAMPGHSCSHGLARPDLGGGSMSWEHLWLQNRIAKIIRKLHGLDLEPVIEHPPSHSDVYVPGANPLAIEIQRWSTRFEARTLAREQQGLQVLWLITEDARGKATENALFRLPAARVRVHDRNTRSRKLRPWDDPRHEAEAILTIYATVAHLKAGALKTWPVSAPPVLGRNHRRAAALVPARHSRSSPKPRRCMGSDGRP